MTNFDEMLNKYMLSHEIFGISEVGKVAEQSVAVASATDSENVATVAVEPEYDSSMPPFEPEEGIDIFDRFPILTEDGKYD